VQEQAGMRSMAERVGNSIRPNIPPATHEFLEERLMAVVGSVDADRQVWPSLLVSERKPLGTSHPLSRTFQRVLHWILASGVLWIFGGLLAGDARYALWVLALTVDYGAPVVGFYTPGLGRSRTEEWTIEGSPFAERCWLFVIIDLGESILVTGMTFGESEASAETVSAFVVAFLGSVAL
jgi:low temperature requirement protein LtrA